MFAIVGILGLLCFIGIRIVCACWLNCSLNYEWCCGFW